MSEADRPMVDLGEGTVMSLARAAIEMIGRGDDAAALDHLEQARTASRVRARRERQVVEIAAAIVDGETARRGTGGRAPPGLPRGRIVARRPPRRTIGIQTGW